MTKFPGWSQKRLAQLRKDCFTRFSDVSISVPHSIINELCRRSRRVTVAQVGREIMAMEAAYAAELV